MSNFPYRMDEETHKKLKDLSHEKNESMNKLIDRAVQALLEKEGK